jgi:hypothetical protein
MAVLAQETWPMKNKNYDVLPDNDQYHAVIEITEGPYAGIKFKFGTISFKEVDDDGILSYNYDIITGQPEDMKKFDHAVGDILSDIITEYAEEQDAIRTDNPKDFDDAGELPKKSRTIS